MVLSVRLPVDISEERTPLPLEVLCPANAAGDSCELCLVTFPGVVARDSGIFEDDVDVDLVVVLSARPREGAVDDGALRVDDRPSLVL